MRRILTNGFLILLLSVVCSVACDKDETIDDKPTYEQPAPDDDNTDTPNYPEQEQPGVEGEEIIIPNEEDLTPTIPQEGGETTIQFTAKAAWSAAVSDTRAASDWLSVSPTAGGAGDVTLTLTTQTNDSTDDREGYIKIYSGDAVATIAVTQKQRDALTVTPSKYALDALESEFEIEVQANVQFEIEIRTDWIEQTATRTMTTTVLTFKAKKNIEGKERTGTIIIRSGEKSETITVTQEKGDFIVDTEKFSINAEAQTISAKVRANTDFEVESKADWIHYNATRAMTSYTLDFDVDENETGEERTGEITVAIGGKTETITVLQSADAFVVDVSQKEFKFDGGTFSVSVKSNIEYRIEIPDDIDWITEIATRTITTTMHNFRVAENTLSTSRSATLKIYYQSGDEEKTHDVTITQERVPLFSDLNQYEIDARAQKVDIKVTGETSKSSNIEYYIIKGVEWISRVDTRAVTADFTFSVDENTIGATREGEIEFTLPDKTTIIVRIVQSGEVEAEFITDENFRTCCINNYDKNGDGIFTKYEAASITSLDVSDKEIKSLEGIEYFTALKTLYCDNNQLTALDVSKNTALKTLYCYDNQLTALNVSGCAALETLSCHDNQLTSLDVSKNTALKTLSCYDNQLTALNVSGCVALKTIYWYNNNFEYINLGDANPTSYYYSSSSYDYKSYPYFDNGLLDSSTKFKIISSKITRLDVSDNKLQSLDVSECPALETLRCYSNPLELLNLGDVNPKMYYVSSFFYDYTSYPYFDNSLGSSTKFKIISSKITRLDVRYNELQSLDVSECPALETLYCDNNPLELLNLGDTNITSQDFYNGKLTSATFKIISSKITWLSVDSNKLQSLDVSGCAALVTLSCSDNQLTTLNVSGCAALIYLYCYKNQLTALNVNGCAALETLSCHDNQLTTLNVSGCAALKTLSCDNNQLTALDVSGCAALETLSCYDNQLTALNVSGCVALKTIRWYNNNFEYINLGDANPTYYYYSSSFASRSYPDLCNILDSSTKLKIISSKITKLDVRGNNLQSLDVSECPALEELSCRYSNQLTSLDVSKNTALKNLYCGNNQLTALNVSGCAALETLSCSDNQLTTLDVSKNTALKTLSCSDNQLTALNVSGCVALKTIYWYNNNFEYINLGDANPTSYYCSSSSYIYESYPYFYDGLSTSTKLKIISSKITSLNVSKIKLQSLDVSGCPALETLSCDNNQLTSLDVSNNTALKNLYCYSNPLELLNLGEAAKLSLACYNLSSKTFKVVGAKIPELSVRNSDFQSLDVSECPALTSLTCEGNQLTTLDVSKNTALTKLRCNNNQLTTLNVSGCAALETLSCHDNQLTALDVSGCAALTYLSCYSNPLTSIYMKQGQVIGSLYKPDSAKIVYVN